MKKPCPTWMFYMKNGLTTVRYHSSAFFKYRIEGALMLNCGIMPDTHLSQIINKDRRAGITSSKEATPRAKN